MITVDKFFNKTKKDSPHAAKSKAATKMLGENGTTTVFRRRL
jgi:hypothetical protein